MLSLVSFDYHEINRSIKHVIKFTTLFVASIFDIFFIRSTKLCNSLMDSFELMEKAEKMNDVVAENFVYVARRKRRSKKIRGN